MSFLLGMSGGAVAAIVVAVVVGGGAVVTAAGFVLHSLAHKNAKDAARKYRKASRMTESASDAAQTDASVAEAAQTDRFKPSEQTEENPLRDGAHTARPVEIPDTRDGAPTSDKYDLDIMTSDGMTNRLSEDRNGVTDEDVQSELELILDRTQTDEIDKLLKG